MTSLSRYAALGAAEYQASTALELGRRVAAGELSPVQLDELYALPAGSHDARGVRGMRVHDGFNDDVRAAGGPRDLAVYTHDDGYEYGDRRVVDALRAGVLDVAARQDLGNHELDERDRGGRTHDELHQLPDLTPLTGAVGKPHDTQRLAELPQLIDNVEAIAVDPHGGRTILLGGDASGVRKSVDGGVTWTTSNTGLTNLAVLPASGNAHQCAAAASASASSSRRRP